MDSINSLNQDKNNKFINDNDAFNHCSKGGGINTNIKIV